MWGVGCGMWGKYPMPPPHHHHQYVKYYVVYVTVPVSMTYLLQYVQYVLSASQGPTRYPCMVRLYVCTSVRLYVYTSVRLYVYTSVRCVPSTVRTCDLLSTYL